MNVKNILQKYDVLKEKKQTFWLIFKIR